MASRAPYEGGGIGGKLRKRPFRRGSAAAATPYDRPPSAIRGGRAVAAVPGTGGGWLSKLVDPASRIIASGASKLFSSVFRKRLPLALPAAAPEANLQSSEEVLGVVANNSPPEVWEQGGNAQIDNSETDGISDLELLLKQKTFTRVEFDRLTELLRSRTVESGSLEPVISDKDKENANVSLQEKGTGSSRLYGNISTPAGRVIIPEEEAASPAEIAKAFMGSMPSTVSPSSLGLRSQVLQEETMLRSSLPYAAKASDSSVPPRSIVRFSGISELSENGYLTPRTRGRSAIYKMSRSPYFKVQPTSNIKGSLPSLDGYAGPSTSSQWTPTTVACSDGKQVLKRRSSVLESDIGSFGPIRRIRHKSNLISPMKDLRSSVSGNLLPSLATPFSKDGIHGSTSSIQTILPIDVQDAGNDRDKVSCATVAPIPPQSSEMARKILQQLDKLVPSPREKSSELKAVVRNESPSKLTLDMLRGQALRSMEDIDSSKFLDAQSSGNIEAHSDSHLPNISLKQDKVEENGHLKAAAARVNMTSEAGGRDNAVTYVQASKSALGTADLVISGSQVVRPNKKPAFKISALEDSLEMDDDDSNVKDVSGPSTAVKDKIESEISESKSVISETISEKAQVNSFQSILASGPKLRKEVDAKVADGLVPAEKAGFSFPVAQDSNYFQTPHTPTMPTPDRSALQKETLDRSAQQGQPAAPVFSFGSKDTPTLKFPSTVTSGSDSSSLKFGASKSSIATPLDSSDSNQGDVVQKALDIPMSMGNMASSSRSTSTMPPVFAFGTSTTSTLSNGSLGSTSLVFSVSTAPSTLSSGAPVGMTFPSSTIASTSSSSVSISSSAPIFSTVTTFQFGSGSSTGASLSVLPTQEKSDSKGLEEKAVKVSPFSLTSAVGTPVVVSTEGSSSPVMTTSYAFSSMSSASSGMATASLLSSSPSASSCLATSSLSTSSANGSSSLSSSSLTSSMGSGSSSLPKSSLFTSTGSGSSGLASTSSSSFSSAGTGIFAFGASTQSSSSGLSFGNNISQTATAFGTSFGSVFGTQAIPSGSGTSSAMSSFSQSTGHIGSFSSSPTFGLSNSSSFAFGSSPFGSSASSARSTSSSSLFSFSAGAGSSSSISGSSFAPAVVPSVFSSSSPPSTSSVFGSTFGSSTSPSTVFSFGSSAPSGSSPPAFGSSSSPAFPFTSLGPTTSSFSPPAQPMFGMSMPATGFSLGSQGNDQMNVEDSMADDTAQAAAPAVPTFGQPINSPFMFSSQGQPAFPFGSHQNSSVPQSPSPFQAGGNLEFPPGGSFSLGSGGADKSGRKFVKVRRDKHRKK